MKLKLKSGAQIFFEDEGQGTPILFLTGFGGNTEIWSGQVNFFLQRGYRVIRLDYLNHGQSDRVDGELQIGDLADEVLQLVDYLQLKDPIYTKTTNYGHFGKEYLPWEKIIKL